MSKLEKYEWESLWWEEPENKDRTHVLYIGDSISRGTTERLNRIAENLAVDNFATSKAVDNPAFEKALAVFATQNPGYTTVLFNNGLHGYHLSGEEYAWHYEKLLLKVRELFADAKLFVLTSTYTADGKHEIVEKRNARVEVIAEKHNLPIVNLYKVSYERDDLICEDKIHFTDNGYVTLAKAILENL